MKRRGFILLLVVLIVFFDGFLLLHSARTAIFNPESYYSFIIAEDDYIAKSGFTFNELEEIHQRMLLYLQGKTDTPQIEMKGKPLYRQRELSHLEDVRVLFARGFALYYIFAAGSAGMAVLYFLKRGKIPFRICLLVSGLMWGALLAAFFLIIRFDFMKGFDAFHNIFFAEGTWLFDENTEVLVRIYEESFFQQMALGIAFLFVLFLFLLHFIFPLILSLPWRKKKGKKI